MYYLMAETILMCFGKIKDTNLRNLIPMNCKLIYCKYCDIYTNFMYYLYNLTRIFLFLFLAVYSETNINFKWRIEKNIDIRYLYAVVMIAL